MQHHTASHTTFTFLQGLSPRLFSSLFIGLEGAYHYIYMYLLVRDVEVHEERHDPEDDVRQREGVGRTP